MSCNVTPSVSNALNCAAVAELLSGIVWLQFSPEGGNGAESAIFASVFGAAASFPALLRWKVKSIGP